MNWRFLNQIWTGKMLKCVRVIKSLTLSLTIYYSELRTMTWLWQTVQWHGSSPEDCCSSRCNLSQVDNVPLHPNPPLLQICTVPPWNPIWGRTGTGSAWDPAYFDRCLNIYISNFRIFTSALLLFHPISSVIMVCNNGEWSLGCWWIFQ